MLTMDKILADGRTAWIEQVDGALFTELAISHLPELAAVLRENDGLVHLQTLAIGDALTQRIACNQVEEALEILQFFDAVLGSGKPALALENALQISFIDAAELCATAAGREVFERAPERIRSMISRTV